MYYKRFQVLDHQSWEVQERRLPKYTDGMSAFVWCSVIFSCTERMNQPLVSLPSRLPASPASVSGLFLHSPPSLFFPLVFSPKERSERNTKGKTRRRVLRPEAQCQLLLLQRLSIQMQAGRDDTALEFSP